MATRSPLLRLVGVLGRRPFLTFGFVSLLTVALLAAVNMTSRYAMSRYVADQVQRVPWDLSIYQTAEVSLVDELHGRVRAVDGVAETSVLYFLRTILPVAVRSTVDDRPLRTPWLSVMAARDPALLPPDLRPGSDGAVLVLVGSKALMGDAFTNLQGARRFELAVGKGPLVKPHDHPIMPTTPAPAPSAGEGGHHHPPGTPAHDHAHEDAPASSRAVREVFSVPIRRVIRVDGTDINRWFMEQTSAPTLVPELGTILVVPFEPKLIAAYDAVSRGIVHDEHEGDIHVGAGDYFPDVIHLARIDRHRLLSGWDIGTSLANLKARTTALRDGIRDVSYSAAVDNTMGVMFARMDDIARRVSLISLLVSLPLLGIAWVLLANVSGLLLLNERRTLGLLRLRGVPGRLIGRSLLLAIGAGGLLGGVLGAVIGTVGPMLVYAGGWLPWSVLQAVQPPLALLLFVVIGTAMALLVSRRLVRYAARISPLEASGRVAASEAATARVRFGIVQAAALAIGAAKVAGWLAGYTLGDFITAPWVMDADRALDFVAFPLFVYGIATLVASWQWLMAVLLSPVAWMTSGQLRAAVLHHLETRRHRVASFLLIVALMGSLCLYPTVMTAVFDNKVERGAQVQLGGELQVTLNAADFISTAARSRGGLGERLIALRLRLDPVLARVRAVPGVTGATFVVEGIVEGLFMPDRGFAGLPIYVVLSGKDYLAAVYHEPALGRTAPIVSVIGSVDRGDVVLSPAVARFYRRAPGAEMPVGRTVQGGLMRAAVGGGVWFLPGMPLKTVTDREGFVSARVDYLNHLFSENAYMVGGMSRSTLYDLDVILPRLVVAVRHSPGSDAAAVRRKVLDTIGVAPLDVRALGSEMSRLGSDMYVFLARENVRLYLLGGLVLALLGILAVAYSNYLEDRRTLALLRIRGAGPGTVLRFIAPGMLGPAVVGLVVGALVALAAGYGITDLVWRLRELQTVMTYLPTRLAVSGATGLVGLLLVGLIAAIAVLFGRWVFRHTARGGLSES